MLDLTDFIKAHAAVQDPRTQPVDLATIAQHHPGLRHQVVYHPNVYPDLLAWLDSLGDGALSAAVAIRCGRPIPPTVPVVWPAMGRAIAPKTASSSRTKWAISGLALLGALVAAGMVLAVIQPWSDAPSASPIASASPTDEARPADGTSPTDEARSTDEPSPSPLPSFKEGDLQAPWVFSMSVVDGSVFLHEAAMTPDGGVVAVGSTTNDQEGERAVVICVNADGEHAWKKEFCANGECTFRAVAVATDGTIIIVGSTGAESGDFAVVHGKRDALVVALDPAGEILWEKTYGGNSENYFVAVTLTPDGTIIVAGTGNSRSGDFPATHGSWDAIVAALSSTGELIWANTYGGSRVDEFFWMDVTSEGLIVVAGETGSLDGDFPADSGRDNCVVAALTSTGEIEWSHTLGSIDSEQIYGLAVSGDDTIYLAGVRYDAGEEGLIHAFSADGEALWTNTYEGNGDDAFNSVAVTSDGSLVIAGLTSSTRGEFVARSGAADALIVKMTNSGEIIWSKTYGGDDNDYFVHLSLAPNGAMVAIGATYSTKGDLCVGQFENAALVVALTSDGTIAPQETCKLAAPDPEPTTLAAPRNNQPGVTGRRRAVK